MFKNGFSVGYLILPQLAGSVGCVNRLYIKYFNVKTYFYGTVLYTRREASAKVRIALNTFFLPLASMAMTHSTGNWPLSQRGGK